MHTNFWEWKKANHFDLPTFLREKFRSILIKSFANSAGHRAAQIQDVWEVQALMDIEFLSLVVESPFEAANCWAEVDSAVLSHGSKLVLKGFAELLHLLAGSMKDPKKTQYKAD